jgi:tripartite-type tricarboxylate transporter receptor subunit TctC
LLAVLSELSELDNMKSRIIGPMLCAVVAALALPLSASAQTFPAKPVNLVVTVTAGGSIDAVARLLAPELGGALGQTVIVQNKPGAGGNIAAEYVAKAPADGYTLLITSSSTMVLNPFVYKSLPFHPVKSFAPVAVPAQQNQILVVHPQLNVSTLSELVALLKARPGKLNYASSGSGAITHLGGVLFGLQTGTQANHIPYKGVAPATTALLAGEVDSMFDSANTIPHIRAGKVRALAVIGPKRLPSLPDVPAFAELGLPGMEIARGWYGIFAPAGTPPEVVQRLSREILRVMKLPTVMERVSSIGLENVTASAEELAGALSEGLRRYEPIVRQAGVTVQ